MTKTFQQVFGELTFWRALGNNLVYSIVPVVVGVITSASAAFSFAKLNWYGRDVVFFILLAAIMVPGACIMTAQFSMYEALTGERTVSCLIIPGLFGSIMTAFFIRQFLYGLRLPSSKPPRSTVRATSASSAGSSFLLRCPRSWRRALLSFMGCWNNYMGSYIFIPQNTLAVNLPHALSVFDKNVNSVEGGYGVVLAGAVFCVLPVMILFACFQRTIISSLMLTGSKE